MKVRVLQIYGSLLHGQILDAIKNPTSAYCTVYDSNGLLWQLGPGEFETIFEPDITYSVTNKVSEGLNGIFGSRPKHLTVEFFEDKV